MRHVPPSAQAHRNFPEAPECPASPASANLRKPPSVPRAAREIFHPDELRVRHLSRAQTTRVSPGSPAKPSPEDPPRALGECATCPGSPSSPQNSRKNQIKCLKLLKFIGIRVLIRKIQNKFSQLAIDEI